MIRVILTNWQRPRCTEQTADEFRVECPDAELCLLDNNPEAGCDHGRFDVVYTATENLGPPCRFLPAFLATTRYAYFHDEDHVVPPDVVNRLFAWAMGLNGRFSTIGFSGIVFKDNRPGRIIKNVKVSTLVDMNAGGGYFIRTDCMHHVLKFRADYVNKYGTKDRMHFHDDFLLCCGIQRGTGWPSYCVPDIPKRYRGIHRKKEKAAFCSDPNHKKERQLWVERAIELGWESCREV